MALNLGVTSCQSLEISLDQFVRGEVLEGSNAYYCEKCKEKVLHLCLGVWVCVGVWVWECGCVCVCLCLCVCVCVCV